MKLELNNGHIYTGQAVDTLNQANPVQNTWYTIIDETNCRIYQAAVNIEDTNEDLEVRITIDGNVTTAVSATCTHSTSYLIYNLVSGISRIVATYLSSTGENAQRRAFLCEGKAVKIEVRKTTAAGAGNLTGVAWFGKMEAI